MGRHSAVFHDPGVAHPIEAKLRDLGLLGELCQRVAGLDMRIGIGLRDAIPRLELSAPGGVVVDVRVDQDGQALVCRPSFRRYPTQDLQAAARDLVEFLRSCDHHPDSTEGAAGQGGDER